MAQLPQHPNPPVAWYCPITREIFRDPVIGSDGHTYERTAIEAWLKTNSVSPITRQPMAQTALVTNYALRSTIQEALGHTIDTFPPKPPIKQKLPVSSKENLSVDVCWVQKPLQPGENTVRVSVRSAPEGTRKPVAFICILDVSGSMGSEATIGSSNDSGFSRLDLVKHSLNTIISVLNDHDVLSIVSFSYEGQVKLAPVHMDQQGKDLAQTTVNLLEPNGGTNLWDGLKKGLELSVEDYLLVGKNTVLLLLTDGEPTINPPRGILPSLDAFLKQTKISCTVHTFGFGYELDSALLGEISRRGNGSYAYIPDCSMVGTVFINFLSVICATAFRDVCIQINSETSSVSIGKSTFRIGLVQYGQSRDLFIRFTSDCDNIEKVAKITVTCGDHDRSCDVLLNRNSPVEECDFDRLRAKLISVLGQKGNDKSSLLKQIVHEYSQLKNNDERIGKLLLDMDADNENYGQIGKACSREDWYTRWGQHYLLAVLSAHRNQVCNNFKDAGVQMYGGLLFQTLQKEAEDKFCSLPPPKPSCHRNHYRNFAGPQYSFASVPAPAPASIPGPAPYSMSSFYDSNGVCFHADTPVNMIDGSKRPISCLKRGDIVETPFGNARVQCLMQFRVKTEIKLAKVGSLLITPFHPICDYRSLEEWKFPADVAETVVSSADDVYNLVLDQHHAIVVDDKVCCTLGHKFRGPKVEHAFFGTFKVIECIKKTNGWKTGRVTCRIQASRNPATNKVASWKIQEC